MFFGEWSTIDATCGVRARREPAHDAGVDVVPGRGDRVLVGQLRRSREEPVDLGRRERGALHDDRREVAHFAELRGDEEVVVRVLDAELLQRLARGHDVAAGPVRRSLEVELAELHHHDAVVGEVLQASS